MNGEGKCANVKGKDMKWMWSHAPIIEGPCEALVNMALEVSNDSSKWDPFGRLGGGKNRHIILLVF